MSKLLYNSLKLIPFGKLPAKWLGTGRAGLILTLLALFLVLSYYYSQVQKFPAIAGRTSPDAIAIRVIPNHQHYSPMRWYKEQDFTGSPQSLIIDGYEAIRDGRTVYVNAANINDQGTLSAADDILYTNIYLMSYNQDAEPATIAIVNQLLQHWHFNTDLPDVGQCVGAEGNLGAICLIDLECPTNEYCNSNKAKVTRDTKRMADLAEIKIALANYKSKHNHYPDLSAGSYLPNKTISTWPSWQDTLANELNITLPADPINRLGDCGDDRFDPITCWDEQAKEFAADLDLPELPAQSRVYFYWANSQGNTANYCAQMETSHIYNNIAEFNCFEEEAPNNPPVISGVSLPDAYLVQPYSGYISAFDPDGDQLNWALTINSGCEQWSNLRLDNTAIAGQKAIQADHAGQIGDICNITITINDNRENGSVSKNYAITVVNRPPEISSSPITAAFACVDYYYQVVAVDADGHSLQYSATALPDNLTINQATGLISGQLQNTGSYNITVIVTDEYNDQDQQAYTLAVTDEVFQVNQISDTTIYVYPAEAVLPLHYGPVQFNHTATVTTANPVTYSMQNNPDWLAINSISGHIQGTPTDNVNDPGNYNITVIATNNCGASHSTDFILTVLENGWHCSCADDTCVNEICIDPVDGTECPGTKLCCPDIDNDGYDNCNIGDLGDDGRIIDCNDNNSSIYPNATEICGNGIDEDCNGSDMPCGPGDVDGCTDQDGDGYPGTDVGTPHVSSYTSLHQNASNPYRYCSNTPGGEYNGYPCNNIDPNTYRYSQDRSGFKDRCDLTDPKLLLQRELTGSTNPTLADFQNSPSSYKEVYGFMLECYADPCPIFVPQDQCCRTGKPSDRRSFSMYVPKGTVRLTIILFNQRDDQVAAVARFGSPPEGDYSGLDYDDIEANHGESLESLTTSDCLFRNTGGHMTIIDKVMSPLAEGGWLYIKVFSRDNIYMAQLSNQVDVESYLEWYNSANWDADGNPVGGVCDTTDPNFDCDDSNPSIHPNAPEICGNGIDEDCDGEIDEGCGPGDVEGCLDKDGDGYPGTDVYTPPVNNGVNGQPEDYVSFYQGRNKNNQIGYHDAYPPGISWNGAIISINQAVSPDYEVSSIPSMFRFYIPPSATRVSLWVAFPQHEEIGIVGRLGLPPQEHYTTGTSAEYYDAEFWAGVHDVAGLATLREQDWAVRNMGGKAWLLDGSHDSSEGEWLYVKLLRFESYSLYVPHVILFSVTVNDTEYTNWYNSFDCWGADGDPLPLLGSCGGICDTSDPNFDCNDNNPSIHPDAPEICGNGIDDDCDGEIDEGC